MFSKPLINDITTTYPQVPQFVAIAKAESSRKYDYHPEFLEKQKSAYVLGPVPVNLRPKVAFDQVLIEAQSQKNWKIISADAKALRIEAVVTTSLLRFKDDVVIEIRTTSEGAVNPEYASLYSTLVFENAAQSKASQDNISWVHMRSRSRLGRGDLGANAQRIDEFLKRISQL